MNELIKLNFLKKYKEKGKYAVTEQGHKAINLIEKMGE